MEKAQVLHSLKQNFDVSEEMFQQLLSQIEDDKYKDNFERITKGLTVEDNYKMVFGSLPWVKNINGLDQNQEKKTQSRLSGSRLFFTSRKLTEDEFSTISRCKISEGR